MPARNARVYRLTAKLTLHGELTDAQIDELLAVAEKCPIHKLMTAVDVRGVDAGGAAGIEGQG